MIYTHLKIVLDFSENNFEMSIIETNSGEYTTDGNKLSNEATELKKIFSSILEKSK